jgi:hypothetical protein
MCHSEKSYRIPDGYRLIDDNTLSFLWFQAAGITLHYFGVGKIQPILDAERIDCVKRLAKLHQEHGDILSEEALLVLDCLITAAINLTDVSGH